MAIQCPSCGRQFDATLFAFGKRLLCDCGEWVDIQEPHRRGIPGSSPCKEPRGGIVPEKGGVQMEEIKRDANRICQMILNSEIPWIDIEIAKERLREKVQRFFPGRLHIHRMIYESRFQRLKEQFRGRE